MTKNEQARELFRDALAGRISRRDLMVKGAALGMSATVLAALSQETMRSAVAQERDPIFTFYSWMTDLHPTLNDTASDSGVTIDVAPTTGFGFDRFVAEAKEQKSTWDAYGGVTPFLEMIALAESGTIEPWDQYLPAGSRMTSSRQPELKAPTRQPAIPLLVSTCGRSSLTLSSRAGTRASSRRPVSIRKLHRRTGTSTSQTPRRSRTAALLLTAWSSTSMTGGH